MKPMKRLFSMLLAVLLMVSILPAIYVPASAIGMSEVQSKLDTFMKSYPAGNRWTSSFDGGKECYGFGKLVIYNLFGEYSGSRYRSWLYDGTSTSGMNIVGSITNYSASNVQSLLSKAYVGDILQFNTTKQHTMVVYRVDSDGVMIYHCNWDGNCGIRLEKFSFGAWSGRNSSKLTLLRSANYVTGPGPDLDTRYPTPFKAYPISNDKIPAYDGVNGSSVGNIYGDQDFCEILEVYKNGWVKLNCPWSGYSNGRIVYTQLSVFISNTSYVPRKLTAVNKTSAYYIANGSSSPGYVYVGDTCTVVSEQGNQYCVICPWSTSTYTGNYLVWVDRSAFPCTHTWNSGSVTTQPTCTAAGVKTYTCTICGAKETESVPALGHNFGNWTKLNDTQHQRVCSRDSSHKETANHSWNSGTITKQPTCTAAGVKTYTCSVCSGTKTESIPALGHSWGSWSKLNDTQHQRVCSRDSSHKETVNHTWDSGSVTTQPTCTGTGVKTYTCTVCKGTKTESVMALGHNWGGWTMLSSTQHQRVCSRDSSHKETASHTWDNGTVSTSPTCTASGVKIYTCTVCKGTKTETVSPIGHDWGAWTNLNAAQHERVCKNDASHKEQANHTWDNGVVTKEPTATESGVKIFTCTVCKATKTEELPITAPDYEPGDINGDGTVNNKDLTRLMKYLAGEDVNVVEDALDVNGDGNVNNKDLTRLMKYLAGEDVSIS